MLIIYIPEHFTAFRKNLRQNILRVGQSSGAKLYAKDFAHKHQLCC